MEIRLDQQASTKIRIEKGERTVYLGQAKDGYRRPPRSGLVLHLLMIVRRRLSGLMITGRNDAPSIQ
jgi:hypothetical protein